MKNNRGIRNSQMHEKSERFFAMPKTKFSCKLKGAEPPAVRKGQLFSLDFIIALLIFLSIVSLFAYMWLSISFHPRHLQQKALAVSEYLASYRIGEESVIDCGSLAQMVFEDYETLKSDLNVYPYEVWIEFDGIDAGICPSIRRNIDNMIVIDRSGSMSGQKLTDAKNAAKSFVDKLDASYDQSGLASFSTSASLDQTLLVMSSTNKTALKNKIGGLSANGFTDIGDAIAVSTAELTSSRARNGAAKIEVLLSDGNPNRPLGVDANQYAIDNAKTACNQNINIYTISLGADANRTLMQTISNITSGQEYYSPSSAQLQGIFDQIANKITASQTYGQVAPAGAKDIGSVTRIVSLNGKLMHMMVRVYEKVEGASKCA